MTAVVVAVRGGTPSSCRLSAAERDEKRGYAWAFQARCTLRVSPLLASWFCSLRVEKKLSGFFLFLGSKCVVTKNVT